MSRFIPLTEAIAMTSEYRKKRNDILKPEYQNKDILAICETFEKSQIETIFSKYGCVGLRVYYGTDSEGKVHAILVGVNEADEDMIDPPVTEKTMDGGNVTLEEARRCPDICPPASPLNSD